MRNHLGVILGARLGHSVLHWANSGILLCRLDLPFYLSFSCLPIQQQTPSLEAYALEEPRRGREALTITVLVWGF